MTYRDLAPHVLALQCSGGPWVQVTKVSCGRQRDPLVSEHRAIRLTYTGLDWVCAVRLGCIDTELFSLASR